MPESNFDPVAFLCWWRRALDCLTAVDLLAAAGILSAAKEQMAGNERTESAEDDGNLRAVALTERIGGSINRRAV